MTALFAGRAKILIPLLLVIGVLVLLLLRGCETRNAEDGAGTTSTRTRPSVTMAPGNSTTTVAPPPVSAATQAALDVMREAMLAIYSWEPATDKSREDAYARATQWLTPELARPNPPTQQTWRGPGLQWSMWADHKIRIIPEVRLVCEDCMPDGDTQVRRTAVVRQFAHAPNGQRALVDEVTVYTSATLTADGWRVSAIKVRY